MNRIGEVFGTETELAYGWASVLGLLHHLSTKIISIPSALSDEARVTYCVNLIQRPFVEADQLTEATEMICAASLASKVVTSDAHYAYQQAL